MSDLTLNDLRVIEWAGADRAPNAPLVHDRLATVDDVVAVLANQGGETVQTFDAPIPELGGSIPTIEVHRPGRYLVYRLGDKKGQE